MKHEQTTYSALLGLVIANERLRAGLEQGQMAELMGLSQASYSRLEGGKAAMSVDQLYRAAKCLNIDVPSLVEQAEGYQEQLASIDVDVVPISRGNSLQGKQQPGVGAFLAGAALGALIMGSLGKK